MGTTERLKCLSKALETMDCLLETILYIQFGIEDKELVLALSEIEGGYAKAITCVRRLQAKKVHDN